MRLLAPLLFSLGCGGAVVAPATLNDTPMSFQPCALEAGTVELPVSEDFALAASGEACLLIDESQEASFVSIAALSDDEEGFALLQEDLRAFLRASGLLGDSPRFTGRKHAHIFDQDVEAHTFVSTPAGLPQRAGFALHVFRSRSVILFVGFAGSPIEAEALLERLQSARIAPSSVP